MDSSTTERAKIRLGIIGTGSVVREIYQYLYFQSRYSAGISVEAICDADAAAMHDFGDRYDIPRQRRFTDYRELLGVVRPDIVAVNTPDNRHCEPTVAALEAGADVLLPKPTADTVADVHTMMQTAARTGRAFAVDFHKRGDPVTKEARARYAEGVYGRLQTASFQMLDRLLVADPNHQPRFFASPDFAHQNSPITFLTSHMADTMMFITGLRPLTVQAVGYRRKLPSLRPIAVDGYDLVDTTVVFESGVVCHILTGWSLPNAADCLTVQSARFVYTDGLVDLWDNHYGYREVTAEGIDNRNVLFRNFEAPGRVGGYGIDNPGTLLRDLHRRRTSAAGDTAAETPAATAMRLGLFTTLVCECATASLAAATAAGGRPAVPAAQETVARDLSGPDGVARDGVARDGVARDDAAPDGVVLGGVVDAPALLAERVGAAAAADYYRGV